MSDVTSNASVDQQYDEQFTKSVNKIGPLTILVAGILSFLPAIYVSVRYDAFPGIGNILSAWGMVAMAYGAIYVIEPISYYAILGNAGTYMSFLSGNIGNMRLPAAAVAQQTLGVEGSSKKGELVATLAIAGSIVTNIIILTIIAIAGQYILAALPLEVQASLKYILPGLFGAMIVMFGMKSPRSLLIGPVLAYACGMLKLPPAAMILVSIFGTIGINFFLYKKTGKL